MFLYSIILVSLVLRILIRYISHLFNISGFQQVKPPSPNLPTLELMHIEIQNVSKFEPGNLTGPFFPARQEHTIRRGISANFKCVSIETNAQVKHSVASSDSPNYRFWTTNWNCFLE